MHILRKRTIHFAVSLLSGAVIAVAGLGVETASAQESGTIRAALPNHAIEHIIVIDLENESFDSTFGSSSPATYLNGTLLKQGELIKNYFATSHVSLGNYISQVSGQAPTMTTNNDCLDPDTLVPPYDHLSGGYMDVSPGTDATDSDKYPGQVVGTGCVYPAPTDSSHGAQTIADQLDVMEQQRFNDDQVTWRMYAQDMGNDPSRDFGVPDPMGGTDCAHPPIGGIDTTNSATASDQYATRHNPFMYFHSVIDRTDACDANVVPLGTVTVGTNGQPDVFTGHLAKDLKREATTPMFAFITPNLCNDGHDATCAGTNTEGTNAGGLTGADLWLKHWMPLIFNSPAYKSGKTLVVITFDEASPTGPNTDFSACCNEQPGPNVSNSGFSPLLGIFGVQQSNPAPGVYPGGGRVGAVVFNSKYIVPGSVNTKGYYNHYSALRSYEDLLGIHKGGDDGLGHLGFAAAYGLRPFGNDVFNASTTLATREGRSEEHEAGRSW